MQHLGLRIYCSSDSRDRPWSGLIRHTCQRRGAWVRLNILVSDGSTSTMTSAVSGYEAADDLSESQLDPAPPPIGATCLKSRICRGRSCVIRPPSRALVSMVSIAYVEGAPVVCCHCPSRCCSIPPQGMLSEVAKEPPRPWPTARETSTNRCTLPNIQPGRMTSST